MKYRATLYTRISCAILLILMIIRNRIEITYASGEIVPFWIEYSDVAIFITFMIILFVDWKRMRLFYQNQGGEEAKQSYRRQVIINWIAVGLFAIYIIGKLMRILSF
ncbi:hypothetical protein [Clostridium merdae]|uniref:hypothetical protein n=1 Tax=Clostridium merdae TaxID=1958780 RepID=UPI000A272329|nr:hypothetical protein [Clostridium merdae]